MKRRLLRAAASFLAVLWILSGTGCYMVVMEPEDSGESVPVVNPDPIPEISENLRERYTVLKGDGSDTVTVMVYIVGSDLETEDG